MRKKYGVKKALSFARCSRHKNATPYSDTRYLAPRDSALAGTQPRIWREELYAPCLHSYFKTLAFLNRMVISVVDSPWLHSYYTSTSSLPFISDVSHIPSSFVGT